jgi:hypothetical protein
MAFTLNSDSSMKSLMNSVCSLLSLPQQVDPAGSQDPNMVLMRTALNLANLELMNSFDWPTLIKMGNIMVKNNSGTYPPPTGEAYEEAYPLPDDFFRFIDQTQWNGAMRFPAVGPVSPQGWMTYMVFPVSANFTLTWQIREGKIWFLNPPPDPGQAFRFMYLSRALVQDGAEPTNFTNIATKNDDIIQLDPLVVALLTRVKWLEAKGFDSSSANKDFLMAYDSRVGAERGANILNLAGNRGGYPYIGIGNLPDASLYGMRQW